MKVIGAIPSRYGSSRFPGKPLADICGKPMLWWVYQQALKVESLDDIVVATDSDLIVKTCQELGMNCMLTSDQHNTPTSRLYEVSTRMEGDKFVFIGGIVFVLATTNIQARGMEFQPDHFMQKRTLC